MALGENRIDLRCSESGLVYKVRGTVDLPLVLVEDETEVVN